MTRTFPTASADHPIWGVLIFPDNRGGRRISRYCYCSISELNGPASGFGQNTIPPALLSMHMEKKQGFRAFCQLLPVVALSASSHTMHVSFQVLFLIGPGGAVDHRLATCSLLGITRQKRTGIPLSALEGFIFAGTEGARWGAAGTGRLKNSPWGKMEQGLSLRPGGMFLSMMRTFCFLLLPPSC